MNNITIANPGEIGRGVREFLELLPEDIRVIEFEGSMGAGKTTFISELCRQMGCVDDPASPTFSIVNEYSLGKPFRGADSIYHFDFYRLKNEEEAREIGAEDYFYSGNYCLLEWGENVEGLLPEDRLKVRIAVSEDGSRVLSF